MSRKSAIRSPKFASVLSAAIAEEFDLLSLLPFNTTAFSYVSLCQQEILLGGVSTVGM